MLLSSTVDAYGTYNQFEKSKIKGDSLFVKELKLKSLTQNFASGINKVIALQKNLPIKPKQTVGLRIIKGVIEGEKKAEDLLTQCSGLMRDDLNKYIWR